MLSTSYWAASWAARRLQGSKTTSGQSDIIRREPGRTKPWSLCPSDSRQSCNPCRAACTAANRVPASAKARAPPVAPPQSDARYKAVRVRPCTSSVSGQTGDIIRRGFARKTRHQPNDAPWPCGTGCTPCSESFRFSRRSGATAATDHPHLLTRDSFVLTPSPGAEPEGSSGDMERLPALESDSMPASGPGQRRRCWRFLGEGEERGGQTWGRRGAPAGPSFHPQQTGRPASAYRRPSFRSLTTDWSQP